MTTSFYKKWLDERWPIWAANVLKFLSSLVRTEIIGVEQGHGLVCGIAHWHGDELALVPRFGNFGLTILVSHSKDGEKMARATRALGYRVTRGSSSRGAVGGLLALIKAVRDGHTVVLAVDGPKGPRGVCKPGIVRVVQKAGVPLFPVGVASTRRFVFKKTWNQVYLPLPFSRQVIYIDKPIYFPKKASPEEMNRHCRKVEEGLRAAHSNAKTALKNRA
jgi:lysophospholipid acyltransferase (LPLAT)-like uncharacterized protein